MDEKAMPSEAAARARAAGLASLERSRKRETGEAYEQMNPAPAPVNKAGQIIPLGYWVDKLKGKHKTPAPAGRAGWKERA
jgi:hypothetical protein